MVPIFTINWHGEEWYWEHEDILDDQNDHNHQEIRYDWYKRHGFDKTLILTKEGAVFNNQEVHKEINKRFTRFGIQESLGLDIH
jgi:hypothetical protein